MYDSINRLMLSCSYLSVLRCFLPAGPPASGANRGRMLEGGPWMLPRRQRPSLTVLPMPKRRPQPPGSQETAATSRLLLFMWLWNPG